MTKKIEKKIGINWNPDQNEVDPQHYWFSLISYFSVGNTNTMQYNYNTINCNTVGDVFQPKRYPNCSACLIDVDLVLTWPSKDGWSSSISID